MKCPPMLHHYDKAEFCINSLLGVDVETVKVLFGFFQLINICKFQVNHRTMTTEYVNLPKMHEDIRTY